MALNLSRKIDSISLLMTGRTAPRQTKPRLPPALRPLTLFHRAGVATLVILPIVGRLVQLAGPLERTTTVPFRFRHILSLVDQNGVLIGNRTLLVALIRDYFLSLLWLGHELAHFLLLFARYFPDVQLLLSQLTVDQLYGVVWVIEMPEQLWLLAAGVDAHVPCEICALDAVAEGDWGPATFGTRYRLTDIV